MNDLYQYPNPHMAAQPQQNLVRKLETFIANDGCLYVMHNGIAGRVVTDSRGVPTVMLPKTNSGPADSQSAFRYNQSNQHSPMREQVVQPIQPVRPVAPPVEPKPKDELYIIEKRTVSMYGNYNVSLNIRVQAEDFSKIKVHKDSVISAGNNSLYELTNSICENYHDSKSSENVHIFNYARMHYFYDTSLKEIVNRINFTTLSIGDIYVDVKHHLSKSTSLYDAYPLLYINTAITKDIDAYFKLYKPKVTSKDDKHVQTFTGMGDFIADYEILKAKLPVEIYTDINERIMSRYKYNRSRINITNGAESLDDAVYVCEAGVIAYTPYLTMELGFNEVNDKTVVLSSTSSAGMKAIFKEIETGFAEDKLYEFILVTRDKDIYKLISGNDRVAIYRIR